MGILSNLSGVLVPISTKLHLKFVYRYTKILVLRHILVDLYEEIVHFYVRLHRKTKWGDHVKNSMIDT